MAIELEAIHVARYLNVIYYILFIAYIFIVFIYYQRKKSKPIYFIALKIFIYAGIILSLMEIFGILTNMRYYVIDGEKNPPMAFLVAIIMGFGEGGAGGSMIYLIGIHIYQKNYKSALKYTLGFAVLMILYGLLTFLITSM
jgi:hypothetical protein